MQKPTSAVSPRGSLIDAPRGRVRAEVLGRARMALPATGATTHHGMMSRPVLSRRARAGGPRRAPGSSCAMARLGRGRLGGFFSLLTLCMFSAMLGACEAGPLPTYAAPDAGPPPSDVPDDRLAVVAPVDGESFVGAPPRFAFTANPPLTAAERGALTVTLDGVDVSDRIRGEHAAVQLVNAGDLVTDGANTFEVALNGERHTATFDFARCATPPCEATRPVITGPERAAAFDQHALRGTGFGSPSDRRFSECRTWLKFSAAMAIGSPT